MKRRIYILILSFILTFTLQSQHCDIDFEELKVKECRKYQADEGASCQLVDNVCKNVYSTCTDYRGDNADVCTQIIPSDKTLKCSFKSNLTPKCQKELKTCEVLDKENCHDISLGETTRICRYIDDNSKCKELVETCTDQENCDASKLPNNPIYLKCEWNSETSQCIKTTRTCNQYIGLSIEECVDLRHSDDKICIYHNSNNACSENYDNNACQKDGVTQTICESMLPLNTDKSILEEYKCVWGTTQGSQTPSCHKERIVFNFNTCELAQSNSDFTMTRDICETKVQVPFPGYCYWDNNECKTGYKKCKDFDISSIKESCENNIIPDFTKKCSFSNNDCKEINRPCSELATQNGVNSDICRAAITSDSKKMCSLKSDNSGCEEVDISQSNSENGEKEETNQSNNIKTKLILALFCLLFV